MSTLTVPKAPNTATAQEIQSLFDRQRAKAPEVGHRGVKERRAAIKKIRQFVLDHVDEINQAIYQDFRKTEAEVLLTESLLVNQTASYTIKRLKRWMKPKRVPMPLTLLGTFSHIRYEPKGTVLIISPWNYPFQLAVCPLINAIAAGNTVILKPSEMTPHTSALLKRMVDELFDSSEVAVVEGDHEIAQTLLDLPFNHIYFTGSPQVGKIVMKAAAKHLASVTLELGGKSPTIVDDTANAKDAAQKIAWGKVLNNGQTCIAPDYLLVHESKTDAFLEAYRQAITKMFGDPERVEESGSYCRIVNARHFERIKGLVEDAREQGAEVVMGGNMRAEDHFIAPTVLKGVSDNMRIMQEEIFGPVLPIISYARKEDALALINSKERPLAMYIYSRNRKQIEYFLRGAISGDAVINDNMIHFSHLGLPFGGVNNSGVGKSGGHSSFKEFSHERSVMKQVYGTMKPLYPPYSKGIVKLVRKALRWI